MSSSRIRSALGQVGRRLGQVGRKLGKGSSRLRGLVFPTGSGWFRWLQRWLARAIAVGTTLALTTALVVWIAVRFWAFPIAELDPAAGGPLTIVDRNGEVLRQVPSAAGHPGRVGWVSLEDIPPLVVSSFLVSEDERFFDHVGVDWRGIVRAAYLNAAERRLGYGGSTITMQLVRMLRNPGKERTFRRKIAESVLAMRLERVFSKHEILEQYLNRAYFGHGAHGIEAAAQTYFGKPAIALSSGEATLLAVIPRAPTAYDPVAHPGAAVARREHVFRLLADRGVMSAEAIAIARATTPSPKPRKPLWTARHFTDHVLSELPAEVRARGGRVVTTLDATLQKQLETTVSEHVDELDDANLDHAGIVVLDTQSGEVRAMVGSAGWNRPNGQINIVTRLRHPGSALKPFIYATAMEQGAHPGTIAYDITDVPSAYEVISLSQSERGPVRFREALAGSYNLAAVHTLENIGVAAGLDTLRRAGIGPLTASPEHYGLRLALGSAKVRLLDLASAFGFVARAGSVVRHRSITAVYAQGASQPRWKPLSARPTQLFSPETAWLTMDMLSDPEARRPAFGDELPIDLPFPLAVKTGTSRGFADTVTLAVTEQLTVAAWAGNFDGEPTQGLIAMEASAPLVRAGLLAGRDRLSINGRPLALTLPAKPDGIEDAEICPVSGMRRGPHCQRSHREHAKLRHLPAQTCTWHQVGSLKYPHEIQPWAERQRRRGGVLTSLNRAK